MTHRFLPLCLFVAACLVGLADGADEPKPAEDDGPVRLKKKNKPTPPDPLKDDKVKDDPKPEDKAKEDKGKEPDEPGPRPEAGPGAKEDEKEILERIAQNMKAVEDRLINKELNESTRQIKEDIIKDIDALIQMAEMPPPSGGGGNGAGSPPPSGKGAKGGSDSQPMNQDGRNPGGKNPGGKNPDGMNPGGKNGPNGNGMGGGSDNDPPKPPNGADDKGKWGQMPESLRAKMNAYATREEYMAKHQELIKEYYRNLAKQSRK